MRILNEMFINSVNLKECLMCIMSFLFFFSLSVTGLKSIGIIIDTLIVLLLLIVYKQNIFDEIKSVDSRVQKGFLFFLIAIILSSICIFDIQSIRVALNYVIYSLQFMLAYLLVKDYRCSRYGIYGLLFGLLTVCVIDLYNYVVLNKQRLGVMFGHPNLDASMIEMLLPICILYIVYLLYKKNNTYEIIFLGVLFLVGVVCLFLTKSRGAILGSVLGLFLSSIFFVYKYKKMKSIIRVLVPIFLVCMIGVFGLYSVNNGKFNRSYDNERLLLIESSYNMWNDHKMFGVGLANWKKEYGNGYILPNAKEPNLSFPHNVYIYYFSTTGIVGGIGFLTFLYLIVKYLVCNLSFRGLNGAMTFALLWVLIAISIHGLVDGGLVLKKCYKLFCGILGMIVTLNSRFS